MLVLSGVWSQVFPKHFSGNKTSHSVQAALVEFVAHLKKIGTKSCLGIVSSVDLNGNSVGG